MPPRIGSLTCLKTLSGFAVGIQKKSSQLGELGNLNLHGSIEISHLERVKNDKDAKEANLSAKANLHSLSMGWERQHRYESEEDKVLEALKPHSNLKYLEILFLRGIRLPDWMNQSVLRNVVSITLKGCKNCSCLPPFGELPCLESLELKDGSAEYVEEDVYSGRFPSLRKLVLWNFSNLKGLLKKEGEEQLPVLEEMTIHRCPIFVIPTLPSLKVYETDAIGLSSISNLRALTSLHISSNYEATSLPEEMFKSLANLKYLKIEYCDTLESIPEEGVKGLTEGMQHLTALTRLQIWRCPIVFKRCEKEIGEDWHKIAHIPYLNISS